MIKITETYQLVKLVQSISVQVTDSGEKEYGDAGDYLKIAEDGTLSIIRGDVAERLQEFKDQQEAAKKEEDNTLKIDWERINKQIEEINQQPKPLKPWRKENPWKNPWDEYPYAPYRVWCGTTNMNTANPGIIGDKFNISIGGNEEGESRCIQ